MKNRLFLGLVLLIAVAMVAGCGGHNENQSLPAAEPDAIQLTVDGQTVNCNAGPMPAPFGGTCLGSYKTGTGMYIYGAVSPTGSAVFVGETGLIQSIMICFAETAKGENYSATVNYSSGTSVNQGLGTATITEYGAVGGKIKGTFDVTLNNTKITGSFNVKRYDNNAINSYVD